MLKDMRPGNGQLAYLPWAYTRPRIGIGVLAPTGGIGTSVSPDRWVGHSFILSCSQSSFNSSSTPATATLARHDQ